MSLPVKAFVKLMEIQEYASVVVELERKLHFGHLILTMKE